MRQTNVRGNLSLRGFRKLRTGAIVATGVILLGLGFLAPTVSASEQDGVWVARTVEEVKADLQKEGDLFKYVIKWGDTLSVISEASNIPVDVLQEMNQASGKNLFLPHNELYFTEAETVSDTVTKHKIVIKESGASGEVRTYEVLLKKDQETKAVTFELTDVTEKVEKMAVNYSPVYQPVSAPVAPKAEESTTLAPKETAPEVVTPANPKVEASTEPAEPKVTEPEAAKPTEPKVEAPTESSEASGTSVESTPEGTVESESTPKETGEEEKLAPKEDASEGTVSEGATLGATAAEGSSEATPGSTEEASGTTPKAEEKDEAPVDDTTSSEVGNAAETSVEETGKQDSITNVPSEESSESSSAGTDSTSEAEELATTETASTSTNEDTNEGESEKPVAEETTVTEGQPATDSTDSSSATSNSADSSPSTESTAPEETLATTGNTSNSSTDVTTSADSGDSTPSTLTSDETKPEEVASEAEGTEGGAEGKEPKVEGQPSGTESATPEQSTNIEETTEKQSGDTSENSGDSLVSDEPAESSGISTSSGTEGAETIDTETTSDKSETPSPAEESVKEEKQVDKKLELRNISSVELYSKEGDKYRHVPSLDSLPSNPETYFMKVKSENFKDVMLPVKTITNDTKDNRAVYKIVASANNLIQHENSNVLENYTYYLPKTQQSETGVYTSFKNLVDAMNSNPYGEFRLGATMDAREVELSDGQESYVKNEFHGTLVGTNNEKYYAIYNLKKPLFGGLNGATVENLSLKDANISAKEDAATVAKEAKNRTAISNVHADGAIAGEHAIGGLVSQVNNSTISNSSYTGRITNTYNTVASYQIGGLVGKLSGSRGLIDKSFASIDLASNATKGDQSIGGIVGAVEDSALISNSYAEGNLNNVQRFANVGGVVGNLWDPVGGLEKSGRLSNVLSDVNVTNGNAITGKDFTNMQASHVYSNKNNKVVNVVQEDDEILTKDSDVQRGEVLEDAQIKEKKAVFASKNTIKTEDFNFSSRYVTDYKNLENADSSKEKVYKNIEKLLPFYNRETIVKYGNLVESSSNLYNKELLSVVPMKDKEVISDINKNKSSINKLLLYYADNTSETLNVNYQTDFSNVAEYRIGDTNLIYTPNTLLHNYKNILDEVLPALNSVEYKSDAIRKVLDVSNKVSLTELYLEEQFKTTKRDLRDSLTKLLTADAAIAENNNKVIDNYVIEKIKNNKEALLLGLTYLERWYNFKYGETKAKDLVMYHLDFFGKSNSSALDNVIELGKSGYNNLLAKNNVITYNVLLAKNYKTNNLFDALEKYRKVFVPDKTNNEWFKEQTKAYIVEEKSTIKEVSDKQSIAGSPQSIGVYDRLTSPSWKYPSMVLPLLTLPEKSVFIIANISTIGFGAYDRYRSNEHPAGTNLNNYVETKAREAAARFRDHYDYWYKILDDKNKEKLYRSVLVYDAFRFGADDKGEKDTYQATFETDHPAIKHFFGPAGNNVVHNSNGAYATGDAFYYMAYRMLDKDGAVTYTHEMTHNSDREIYLGGYGRRNGLGPEFYAKGLLQAPDHPYDPTITINSILKYEEPENPTRLQVKNPTERFKNAADLQKYMHNMFDVIYMLEYLEGNAVVNLEIDKKNELLRKIENKFETDPDGSNTYATNVIRYLTGEELNKLNSFESLIENDVITRRGYENGNDNTFKRNGYYTIKLFSPIYAALSNNKGTPGDLMGRRMAFELLAAKGFKDGMVPYISNQYAEEAKANGHVITSYGKVIGNVTDDLVLKKVFNNEYKSWVDFKKAMYNERKAKFNNLISISFYNPNVSFSRNSKVTITNIDMLRNMITDAVKADAEDELAKMYLEHNRVHKLKQAIFKAYLDQTNDFRSSIFDEEK
ncbi:ZmpA/ZmpB/ZmpC family metallo-endopeptidase [Streptococcus sp. 9903]|uniref:ZmpA/ZmpB/ZmpC family metallo-endopeptidase n=1 Tax=Streptococcus sp. 9903 TaxID=2582677 RepID=UPI0015668478|nr:ZmpA/ZmpB/ZmpC family metallo-endopeptidase [Streptococcus sp. 9903]